MYFINIKIIITTFSTFKNNLVNILDTVLSSKFSVKLSNNSWICQLNADIDI